MSTWWAYLAVAVIAPPLSTLGIVLVFVRQERPVRRDLIRLVRALRRTAPARP